MAEKIFEKQINFGWGLSFNMTGKAPAVAKRIFDKYEDALAYANDVNDSAIEGLVLSVVADSDATKNGLYFVKQIATPAVEADEEKGIEGVDAKEAILVKISTNADSQATADEVQDNLDIEIQARKDADNVLSGAIDTNAAAISANTELIEGITQDLEDLSTANTEAHTAFTESINANTEAIESINSTISDIQDDLQSLVDENNAAHTVMSGAIDANTAVIETLKIHDVKSGDKILAVDADGKLSSTFAVDYVAKDNKIYFKGLNDVDLGNIDTTDFVKDGMLQDVSIDKSGGKTELVFTWNITDEENTDTVKTTRLTVNDFLDGTELSNLQSAFNTHVASANTMHFSADDRAAFDALMQNYNKAKLDEKFASINDSLTANTEAHTNLALDIASANTRIDTVAQDLSNLSTANTEAHTAMSGAIDANAAAIDKVAQDLSNLSTANTEAHTAFSNAISEIDGKVQQNQESVNAEIVDLKANKVSSVVAEEGSNIVITESKNENGISYTIGFQWLSFE